VFPLPDDVVVDGVPEFPVVAELPVEAPELPVELPELPVVAELPVEAPEFPVVDAELPVEGVAAVQNASCVN